MRSTFKILFYVKKGSEKPNGNLPLMCRLTVDGEVKQFSCKMDVPPRLWDVKNGRATSKSLEAQKINAAVDRIRVDVNCHYQELMSSDGYVSNPPKKYVVHLAQILTIEESITSLQIRYIFWSFFFILFLLNCCNCFK